MPDPVILELAVNGATPRGRNRHVPRNPGEIAEVALAGVELGASIVHSHNDEPMFISDGVHAVEPYLASWRPVLERYPSISIFEPGFLRATLTWQRCGRLPPAPWSSFTSARSWSSGCRRPPPASTPTWSC